MRAPVALLLAALARTAALGAAELVNLAPQAKVSASTEYSADYAARGAVDGKVPDAEGCDDLRQAWAVLGRVAKGQGEFTLTWPQPVQVAEIVYFGRTGWSMLDTFRDYEVWLDDDAQPAAKGAFALIHGPQRVPVTPREVRRVRLRFLSAHGPHNPGASEIAVYSASPSDAELSRFGFGTAPSPLKDKLLAGEFGFAELVVVKRRHWSTSHVYTYHAEGFKPGGGLYVFHPATGKLRELVNAGQGAILDCDLSYDGREILFSWKRKGELTGGVAINHITTQHRIDVPEEDFQIYRINVDGTGLTQLTSGPANSLNPCWLPDGGIAFISDRKSAFAYCFVSTSPVLHRMERDGSRVQCLSASYLMDFTPAVLNDGRICYTRWEYVDRPAIPIQGLWAIHPDGTSLSGFFGNRVLDPGTFMQVRPVPGASSKVLCLLTGHNGDPRGAVGLVDIAEGANAQAAIRNLTPEINIGRVDRGNGNILANRGTYEHPYPVGDRHFLVSKSGSIELRAYDGQDPPARLLARAPDGLGYYSPTPLAPRPRPPVLAPQALADKPPAWATVFLADVCNGLAPQVKRGEVTQVAVVEEIAKLKFAPLLHANIPGAHGYASNTAFGYQFPLVSCGATYAPKRIWGYADVAPDGSACFQVPANLPLYFLALDREGRAVQRMRTFTHFMPGEQQGCIGCHAERNYAVAGNRDAVARKREPQPLRAPEWGQARFGYRAVVQPVLDRHCVGCHNARSRPHGLDLSGDLTDFFNVSYEHLARKGTWGERNPGVHDLHGSPGRNPYTSWIPTINGTESNVLQIKPRAWGSPASKLADLLLAGHPGADGRPRVSLSAAERRRVFAWIDLNVPYYPTSSSRNFAAMGCRRLLPTQLEPVLAEVARRRCASCHTKGVPRDFYLRIERPELNGFLLAPLAKEADGLGRCVKDGQPVFASPTDPDYQALLKTFEPTTAWLREKGREDLPTWQFDAEECRLP